MEELARSVIAFVHDHQAWAAPIVFVLAFGESLAFVSLLVPAWSALIGIGALIGATDISFWPVWLAGALGAGFGDWLSYWIGDRYKNQVATMWPLSRYPTMLPRAESFMRVWGVPSIFIGRFFGPLRASIPLVAGIFEMPYWRFQIANFSSAMVWSAVLLASGDLISFVNASGSHVLRVLGLPARRGPASEAALCYEAVTTSQHGRAGTHGG